MLHRPNLPESLPRELYSVIHWQQQRWHLCYALLLLLIAQHEHEGHVDEHISGHLLALMTEVDEQLESLLELVNAKDLPF